METKSEVVFGTVEVWSLYHHQDMPCN